MIIKLKYILFSFVTLVAIAANSQNETRQWYFGNQAALNFSSTPPTPMANGAMQANYSCASIANAAGNLLFYTNGSVIYDQTHNVMANGSGLLGNNNGSGGSQQVIIIKKPSSASIYYVFHCNWINFNTSGAGLYYTEVDMSLASGNGSVTVKNATVAIPTSSISIGKLTATRHCNGTDIWLVSRDWYWNNTNTNTTVTVNNNFRSFLISAAGVNTVPVISSPTTYTFSNNFGWTWDYGCMKISPNGKKLGVALYGWNNNNNNNSNNNSYELFDYDNTTGVVSNSLALMPFNTINNWNYAWGCEFSPDGTKFYGGRWNSNNTNGGVFQWDLCAGSPTAVVASVYTVAPANNVNNNYGALQLAPNGKIYIARWNQQFLDVINNPNAAGSACGYTVAGQSIAPKTTWASLPNFMGSYFNQLPPATPFTYTANNSFGCQTASFTSNLPPNFSFTNCAVNYSLTGILWNFGDPASGSANTSTLVNPSHAFTTLGTYTTQLIRYFSCGGGTDTIKGVVNITQPCISVSSTSITCANLGSATVTAQGGIGPYSYTWMPTAQSGSVATGLSPGTYTLTVFDFGNNFTYTASTVFTSLIPLTGNLNNSSSITCHGASTGTANFTNFAGGSPVQNYLWSNGTNSYTVANPTTLSAGLWSVTVTDALTGCLINSVFFILQPPALNLNLSASTATACVNTSITLTGTTSGGTPGYAYNWNNGPATDTFSVSQALGGTYVYTLNSTDSYSCPITNTISVAFVSAPSLTLNSVSICPLTTGTLSAAGANTYAWSNSTFNNTLIASPSITSEYTVIGSALGCSAAATASIIVKPLPIATFTTNSAVCNGQNLSFGASGGTSFYWTGPVSFTSNLTSIVINAANPNHSGVYNLTLTGVNTCTSSSSYSLTVHPTPTVSAFGGSLCDNQSINLSANSFPGASFVWSGPAGFVSYVQNPSLVNPAVNASGNYTVKVTSAVGCTNETITNVTVTALPTLFPTSDSPECFGGTLNFNASANGAQFYNWTGPNGFTSNLPNPSITNVTLPAAGIYMLQVSTGPCVISKTVTPVVIHALPTPSAISNSPICELDKLIFTALTPSGNVIASYLWTGVLGFNKSAPSPVIDSVGSNNEGVYYLKVIDYNGCQATTTLAVSVLSNPILSVTNATVCLNQEAILKVSGAGFYVWTSQGVGVSSSSVLTIPSANNPVTTPAVYSVLGIAPNGCKATATASVTTLKLPVPTIIVSPSNKVCFNSEVTLNGQGGLIYSWLGANSVVYQGQTIKLNFNTTNMAGTYSLTAYDKMGCRAGTTTFISIDALPDGVLKGVDIEDCVPFNAKFVFKPSFNTGPVVSQKWWLEKTQFQTDSFNYPITRAGNYFIKGTITDGIGCENNLNYTLTARPKPLADFSWLPEKPVENFDEVVFLNASKGEAINQFFWSFSVIKTTSEKESPSLIFNEQGLYPVALVVKNTWGCADTAVKVVKVEPDFNVFTPTIFTPNGDGNNDLFLPVTRGIKFYSLSIFNRWGQLLFETTDDTLGWNGIFNGKDCEQGTYAWTLNISSLSGLQKQFKGSVVLAR